MKRVFSLNSLPDPRLRDHPEVSLTPLLGFHDRALNEAILRLDQFGEVRCAREERLQSYDPIAKIHIILEGRGEVRLNGATHRLHAGRMYLLGPSAIEIKSPRGLLKRYARFHLTYQGLDLLRGVEVLSCPAPNPCPRFTAGASLRIKGLVYSALGEFPGLLERLLDRLHQLSGYEDYLNDLNRRLGEEKVLETLPTPHGWTRAYFAMRFKQRFGMSPKNYLTLSRLEKAKGLLTAGGETLGAVAAQTGFEDRSHFSKVFKRQFGVSPGEFRSHFTPREGPTAFFTPLAAKKP